MHNVTFKLSCDVPMKFFSGLGGTMMPLGR